MRKLAVGCALLAASLLCVGCVGRAGDPSGPDAATGSDSGLPGDGGTADAGTPPDAGGGQSDGGTPPVDECAAPGADWIFCSSFEEGNKAIWDDYDGNPDTQNQLMADPGPFALAANHVIRLRVPPGRGASDLIKVLPSQPDKVYARWYVKWEAGFDFTVGNHGSGLHAGDRSFLGHSDFLPNGDDWFSSWVEPHPTSYGIVQDAYTYYRGMYQDCADPMGACWGDTFPCMSGATYCTNPAHLPKGTPPTGVADRWTCLEMMLDSGTPVSSAAAADGVLDFWQDGYEFGPWDKLWLRTSASVKPSILYLNLFHHADHSVAGLLIDNVVVSTSRIGCP